MRGFDRWRVARLGWAVAVAASMGCIEDPAPAVDDAEVADGALEAGLDARSDSGDAPPRDGGLVDVTPTSDGEVDDPDAEADGGPVEPDGGPADGCPTTAAGDCDRDRDDVPDAIDTCPDVPDPAQRDGDGDGLGDACDLDDDGDGVRDAFDRCPWLPEDAGVADCAGDVDGDGVPDVDDRCPGRDDRVAGACVRALDAHWWTKTATTLRRDGETMLVGTHGGLLRAGPDGGVLGHWTTTDGLAGNRITAFEVGADDAIWVATERGLSVVRPDGLVLLVAHPGERVDDVAVFEGVVYSLFRGQIWRHDRARSAPFDPPVDADGIDDAPVALVSTADGVWRISRDGARRIAPDVVFADGSIADLTPLRGGDIAGPRGPLYVFGDTGMAEVDAATGAVGPWLALGSTVHDVAAAGEALDLATPEGLRRVDPAGRLLPGPRLDEERPPPLPARWVSAAERGSDGALWVATEDGTLRVEGAAATFRLGWAGSACVTGIVELEGQIYISGAHGLRVVGRDGAGRDLPAFRFAPVDRVEVIDGALWVAAEGGISVLDADGEELAAFRRGDVLPDAPITAIVPGAVSDEGVEVWVGTDGGGLARRAADGEWTTFGAGPAPGGLSSDVVRGLAYDDGVLWVATPLGLDRHADGAFGLEPIVGRFSDVAAGGGRVFAASAMGLAVRAADGRYTTLRRQNDGIPDAVGTDEVVAVELVGDRLWLAMAAARRVEAGSLVVRAADPAITEAFSAPLDTVGLPESPPERGARFGRTADGAITYAACGEDLTPGGGALLWGEPRIGAAVDDGGLPDGGPLRRLVEGPEHAPMVVGATRGGAFARTLTADGVEPLVLPLADAVPADCAFPSGGERLWCSFPEVGFGRGFGNDQWNVGRLEAIPALDPDLRAVATESDARGWIASASGVIEVDGGSVQRHHRASTRRAFTSDDTRDVLLAGGLLYAATAEGIVIGDLGDDTWRPLDAAPLPSPSTRAVAPLGEALWIATDAGLALRPVGGGGRGDFGLREGLPSVAIVDVAVDVAGRVWAATPDGLARIDPGGHFDVLGPADGLPGRGAYALHVDADGMLWVQSDDGIARAAP